MNDEAPHPTVPRTGAGATMLRLLLWLLVLLAGLAVVIVLPMILVLNAMGGGRAGIWPLYVWLPLAFLVALWSVVTGLQSMADPRPRQVAVLAGLGILAFFTFPPFWLPET